MTQPSYDSAADPFTALLSAAFPAPSEREIARFSRDAAPLPDGFADRATARALAELGLAPQSSPGRSSKTQKAQPRSRSHSTGVTMHTFAVQAVDGQGKKINKLIEAVDRSDAMAKVKELGFFPTKVKEAKGKGRTAAVAVVEPKDKQKAFTIGSVSLSMLTTFTQQLATLQDAGLPIVRSLRILEGQLKPGVLKNALMDVSEDVESGATLSEAMGKHPRCFDRLYVGMIKAGEAGGVLDTILDRLANFMEKSLKLKKKVIGALIYPIVVTVVAVGILAGIMKFVIPAFKKMFEETGIELPAMTELLIGVSNAVTDYWFLIPAIPIALLLVYKGLRSHPRSKYALDKMTLFMPVFGTIIHKSTVSRFSRTLGTLIASGVPILESLGITREATGNDVIAKAIDDVHASIREGESIASPLQEAGVFDDMMVNMIDIGEETGELDKMLNKIADNYDDDVDIAVESLSSIIEPILIVGMGGAVGFIVIALFLPLISLIEKL